MKHVKIHFLGGARTVTGSKFIIETPECTFMVDCGMFQGLKTLREQNWKPLPFDVYKISNVLLTHGHLDHTGYLPRLLKEGFIGEIIATEPTKSITEIILKDSGKIHEEGAKKANEEGYTKHKPAKAFYTIEDAIKTISLIKSVKLDIWYVISKNVKYRFRYNGHIIGATFIELDVYGKRMVFSGDVGRTHDILLEAPKKPEKADYLFIESTYGNKLHPKESVTQELVTLINKTIHNKGNLIIPSFAVERLQTLMYILYKLHKEKKIPNIPIFIDSPMGTRVLSVFERFSQWHKMPMEEFHEMKKIINIITSYKETWETIDDPQSKIIIAGSGMVTGGRVLTYLKQLINKPETTVLLVGYQAEGTRGRQLLDGVHELKFHGKWRPVKAAIHHIESLSAHADQNDLLNWLSKIKNTPENVFLIHGEPSSLDTFRVKLVDTFNWKITVPKLFETKEIIIK